MYNNGFTVVAVILFVLGAVSLWLGFVIPKYIKGRRGHQLELARENTKAQVAAQAAAKENRLAKEAERDAAKLTLQAEETRLKRVRLEQQRDLR